MFVVSCGGVSQQGDPDAAPPDASDDPCLTNTCECEVDADCDQFEVCDTTSTPGRICTCAPAYGDNGGGACAFTGAPADPGFQATDVWIPSNAANATFDPGNAGGSDLGVGILDPTGQCELDSFSQVFTMPPRDRSQAFVLDVNYRYVDPNFMFPFIPARVSVGGGWYAELPSQEQFALRSFCLGGSAYGGDVEFRITPNNPSFDCPNSMVSFEVDRVAVRPAMAGECPEQVGQPVNADMEGNDGWTFATTGDGTAAFVPGVGNNGSQGVRFTTTTRCSGARATTPISLPSIADVPNPAIEFFTGGNPNDIMELQFGNRPLSRWTPTNSVKRVCVPDWAKGTVGDLSFFLRQTQQISDCSLPRARSTVIDDVDVVNEPACGDVAQDYDNGFETFYNDPALTPGWAAIEGVTNTTISIAEIDNNQAQANSGFGSLHLRALSACTFTSRAERDIIVPPAANGEGPAIVAFINAPASTGNVGISAGGQTINAPEGQGYTRNVLCLPRNLEGRPVRVELFANGGGGGCATNPNTNGFFDDVEIGTDPSCPGN